MDKGIRIMGYRPVGFCGVYGRYEIVKRDHRIYLGPDGGEMREVTDPGELEYMKSLFDMQRIHMMIKDL